LATNRSSLGFAAFFSIFEVTRRVALNVRTIFEAYNVDISEGSGRGHLLDVRVPRIAHSVTLIVGGVSRAV
jgi:hypothetical protein